MDQDTLIAKKLVLVDDAGLPRVLLSTVDNRPCVALMNDQGVTKAALPAPYGDPVLSLPGKDGQEKCRLLMEDDASVFEMKGTSGEVVLTLRLSEESRPQIAVLNAGGQPRGLISINPEGNPTIYLADIDNNHIVRLIEQDGKGEVFVKGL